MSVNIIWSYTNGGDPISTVIDHGNVSNGAEGSDLEIYVRHDGSNDITDAALYMRQLSGTYSGSFTPSADFAELIGWGDASTDAAFGGFLVNLNATTSFATGWPVYNDKSPTGGFVHRTGVGDSEGNAVTLPTSTFASSAGTIPSGTGPGVHFATRVAVPDDEDTIGIRQWDHVLRYNFTS